MRLAISALILLLASSVANAETIAGRASVIDGDTLEIHGERIRILDIDAPESRQTCTRPDGSEWRCGQQASIALADWIGTRTVICETDKHDQYGRHLAHCAVADEDIATWLASNGWGVPYRNCKCEVIRDAANAAKLAKVGTWSGAFVMPWDWRNGSQASASDVIEPSPSWRDQLSRIGDGGGMVYLTDLLLGALGAGLVIVLYQIVKTVRSKPGRNRGNPSYAFPRHRRFRMPPQYLISSLILLTALILYLWQPAIRQPLGLVPQSSSGSCNIKGNISASGERIYHMPTDRYYDATGIDESRGERWFCSESEAVAAGWRPAKV
jgi:endonuclease YncB( thermonuclease family)